jgi:hypothetical protein
MFAGARLSASGPDLTITAHLKLDRIKRARRWAIQNISGLRVKGSIVTGTLEALMRTLEINRT